MSIKSPRIPSYCIHTARNQAYVRLDGEMIYLGVPHSPASREHYDRVIAEWMQAGRVYLKPAEKQGISVNEVLLAYRRCHLALQTQPPDVRDNRVQNQPAFRDSIYLIRSI